MQKEKLERQKFIESFNVSRETLERFDVYVNFLKNFQTKFNLIGNSTINRIWSRHFYDSAISFKLISGIVNNNQSKSAFDVADVGSGAGFPGVVLALFFLNAGIKSKVYLIESSSKKAKFLSDVSKELGLNTEVINKRAETINHIKFDFVVARAVASLDKLLKIVLPICKLKTILLFHKGRTWKNEVKIIKNRWKFDELIVKNNNNLENSGGVILIIKSVALNYNIKK